jgi:hypothetical protein
MKLCGLKVLYEFRGITVSVDDCVIARMDTPIFRQRKARIAIPRQIAILRGIDCVGIRFMHRVSVSKDGILVSEIFPLDKLPDLLRLPSEKEVRKVFDGLEICRQPPGERR